MSIVDSQARGRIGGLVPLFCTKLSANFARHWHFGTDDWSRPTRCCQRQIASRLSTRVPGLPGDPSRRVSRGLATSFFGWGGAYADYTARVNLNTKVLDFVQFGWPIGTLMCERPYRVSQIGSPVDQAFHCRVAIPKRQVEPTSFPKGRMLRPPPASSMYANLVPLAVY